MAEIKDYSATASSNNSASPNGMATNMAPSGVDDSWREGIARLVRYYNDVNATLVTGGSSNTYTLSASRTIGAYSAGDTFLVEINHSCNGASTLNVDSVGAKAIISPSGDPMRTGDLVAGGIYWFSWEPNADSFVLGGALGTSQNGYIKNSSPNILLENTDNVNSDGGRESTIQIKGKQDGNEITTLATIVTSHDGGLDDQKGVMKFNINDGDDGDSPSKLALKLNSAGDATYLTQPITPNPTFRAYRSGSDQSMSHNTATKVELNAETFDIGGYYDHSSNFRYTPLVQGYYQVNGSIQDISNTDVYDIIVYVYKNGSSLSQGRIRFTGVTNDDFYTTVVSTSDIIYMNGSSDYLELYAQIASEDASGVKVNDNAVSTFMSACLLSRTA